ncbi:MAG TPA: hypothetical protein VK581_10710 [Chthoniobacterales bacterium]|nr:hypothetical protein [Chthoniobacterales bacterium]
MNQPVRWLLLELVRSDAIVNEVALERWQRNDQDSFDVTPIPGFHSGRVESLQNPLP